MKSTITFVVIFHNAEKYAEKVLANLWKVVRDGDQVLVVADGCSDRTVSICAEMLSRFVADSELIQTNDLHEIGALNVAFGKLKNQKYVMHIQGDMVIDPATFRILREILETRKNLGVLSLRMGGCFKNTEKGENLELREMNFGHNFNGKPKRKLLVRIHECCIAGRGPLIINREIIDKIGGTIDSNLRPHSIDDVDLSLLSLEFNLSNFVINLPYRSDITWGATRSTKRSYKEPVNISAEKNMLYVLKKHRETISKISNTHSHPFSDLIEIKVTPYFLLGMIVNRQLIQSDRMKLGRVRRKLAFVISSKTI